MRLADDSAGWSRSMRSPPRASSLMFTIGPSWSVVAVACVSSSPVTMTSRLSRIGEPSLRCCRAWCPAARGRSAAPRYGSPFVSSRRNSSVATLPSRSLTSAEFCTPGSCTLMRSSALALHDRLGHAQLVDAVASAWCGSARSRSPRASRICCRRQRPCTAGPLGSVTVVNWQVRHGLLQRPPAPRPRIVPGGSVTRRPFGHVPLPRPRSARCR